MLDCDGRVKGLKHRREKDEAVSAYFSHIGELYQVHHLWCEYADVVSRQESCLSCTLAYRAILTTLLRLI